jgi:hypothetical protein
LWFAKGWSCVKMIRSLAGSAVLRSAEAVSSEMTVAPSPRRL